MGLDRVKGSIRSGPEVPNSEPEGEPWWPRKDPVGLPEGSVPLACYSPWKKKGWVGGGRPVCTCGT